VTQNKSNTKSSLSRNTYLDAVLKRKGKGDEKYITHKKIR